MRQIFETRALRKRHQSGETTSIVVLSPPLRLTLVLGWFGIRWCALVGAGANSDRGQRHRCAFACGVINNVRAAVDGRARWTFADSRFTGLMKLCAQREPESLSNAEVMELSRSILRSYAPSQSSHD